MHLPEDRVAQFRQRAVPTTALVLACIVAPAAVASTLQALQTADPFMGVLGGVYAVGAVVFVALVHRHLSGHPIERPLMVTLVGIVVCVAFLETPAGASHALGLSCMVVVAVGQLTGLGDRRLIVGAACLFPAALLARQLYRPNPLFVDAVDPVFLGLGGGFTIFAAGYLGQQLLAAFQRVAGEARAAERTKDRFLQNMSHELRTPLNAIIGYAELLEEDLDDQPDLVHIQRAGRHLVGIVDDLLDLSRLREGGQLPLATRPMSLGPLLEEVRVDVLPALTKAGNELVLPDDDIVLLADPVALRRVLVNLLGNAARFTQQGEVRVELSTHDGVELRVCDTGEGFDPARAEALFQPFVQADDSSTRRRGGTGLGLAISRALTEAMGGTLTATAVPGRGATFTMRWPRTVLADEP